MKRLFSIIAVCLLMSACGSGGGPIKPEGPILSVDEAVSIVLDQFYVNGGLEDEFAAKGEFSVYLRDAGTGQDIACTSAQDGMKDIWATGIHYAGLSIPLREVDSEHPSSMARFQVVFVEKDGDDCPKPIGGDDDVVGLSPEFSFDGLMNQEIHATDELGVVVFRYSSDPPIEIGSMEPSTEAGLVIDKLYFEDVSDGRDDLSYYLFAERVENGEVVSTCSVDTELMSKIGRGGIVYAALGFPISCFDPNDPQFAAIPIRMGLYIQREGGPEVIGETEVKRIDAIIGEKVQFANGRGYVSFRTVVK